MKYQSTPLIEKFLNNELSYDEIQELKIWLQLPENKDFLKKEIQLFHLINTNLKTFDSEKAFNKNQLIIHNKTRIIPIHFQSIIKYAIAASIVLLISLTFLFTKSDIETAEPIIVNNNIEIGTDKATLTLEDGTNVTLEKGKNYVANNLSSNGEEIIYNTPKTTKQEIVYNYLTIPKGGQYFIKLSDGTQVWLNSESQLKYPVNFVEGKTREVELVYGEAYFDVSPSEEHGDTKFKVFNKSQEIEVLGTEFNIKAYKDEVNIYTTLVEGKVVINNANINQVLIPGQQSNLDVKTNSIYLSMVNVYNETSWKNGVFSFQNMPLKEIMKVLTRWYDMEVVFENPEFKNMTFNGGLKKKESITEILSIIHNTNNINYEINNKTITFK